MSSNGCAPVKDLSLNSLVVCGNVAFKDLTISNRLSVKSVDIKPSFFTSIDTVNVSGFQSSGGSVGDSIVSLQVTFTIETVGGVASTTGITVAQLPAIHSPLGVITGVGYDAAQGVQGALILDSSGALSFTNTSTVLMPVGTVISGSLTYLV
jgi:hypothetical protein